MVGITVIGCGPAGISAAIYAARAGVEVTVVGTGKTALKKAHKIENYYGFSSPVTGEFLFNEGIKQAKALGVGFVMEEVVGIGFGRESGYEVTTTGRKFETRSIVIATGSQRTAPPVKGLKEFEGSGVSYCAVCDGFFFRGKNLAVLGNGQYAVHEALELISVAKSVTILTDGKEMEVEVPEGIEVNRLEIEEIYGNGKVESVHFKDGSVIDVCGVFVAVGVAGSGDLARKLGVALNGSKISVNEHMETNVPLVYAAGDCTGGMLQIAKAVYEGAIAGSEAAKAVKSEMRR